MCGVHTMESFFAKPTLRSIVEHIYHEIIAEHEGGGREFRYQLPPGVSRSFANDVVDRLGHYIHDADVIELNSDWIVIEWS